MTRRGLRPGDALMLDFHGSGFAPDQKIPARVIAKDENRLLAVVSPVELAGFDVSQATAGDRVVIHWDDNDTHTEHESEFELVDFHDPAVGVVELAGASPEPAKERRGPRLHYRLDAKLWTPEAGLNTAIVVDLSPGGARVRVPSAPSSDSYELHLAVGDESVEVHADVVEILQSVQSGSFELRLRFVDVSEAERATLDKFVSTGVDTALDDLRARLLEPTY